MCHGKVVETGWCRVTFIISFHYPLLGRASHAKSGQVSHAVKQQHFILIGPDVALV